MDKWEVDCFSLVWRTCNVLMALFFSLATYVQKNDPDAALWMVGYGIPAASCLLISIKGNATDIVLWRRLVDLHILVSTSIATLLGWTLLRRQSENILQQEEGRKVGGVIHLFTAVTITLFPLVMWLYYYVNDDLRASWPSHCKTAL
ncbi:transmembrane protein 220 isoform X2 [Scleropages formosus]|uniref:transmembrane protein 220 isoform X2 n=1 Tax=Scleropages formosus TaxID=113540 RepID=UPI0008783E0C|nr:transmembrane protein 220 isoform X2 [Scleropages formosus]